LTHGNHNNPPLIPAGIENDATESNGLTPPPPVNNVMISARFQSLAEQTLSRLREHFVKQLRISCEQIAGIDIDCAGYVSEIARFRAAELRDGRHFEALRILGIRLKFPFRN
jgi:hypothetical protein